MKLFSAFVLACLATLALTASMAIAEKAVAGKCCLCNVGKDADGNPVITCPCNKAVGGNSCIINADGCYTVGECIGAPIGG